MEEVEEQSSLVTKELREKSRDYELLKRSHAETQRAVQLLQVMINSKLISRQLVDISDVIHGAAYGQISLLFSHGHNFTHRLCIIACYTPNERSIQDLFIHV